MSATAASRVSSQFCEGLIVRDGFRRIVARRAFKDVQFLLEVPGLK